MLKCFQEYSQVYYLIKTILIDYVNVIQVLFTFRISGTVAILNIYSCVFPSSMCFLRDKFRPENIFWRSMFNHSYIVKILLISHLNKPNYMIWRCQISKPNSCTLTWNKLSMLYSFRHCSLFLKLRITVSLVVNSVLNSIDSNWVNWKRRNRNCNR